MDFSRAFDSIVDNKLFNRLESYGITGELLYWISSFVQDPVCDYWKLFFICCQSAAVVPAQGSVLGPILFIIFINDIDSVCHGRTNMELFVDDEKFYSEIDFKWSFFILTNIS